jgi:hypothetical protein
MAIALLGYFGSMVAVLAGIMMLFNVVFADLPQPSAKPQLHPRPAVAQVEQPESKLVRWGPPVVHGAADTAGSQGRQDVHSFATAQSEKARRLKVAQAKKRKMLARRQEEQSYTAALGYDQEPFNEDLGPFEPRRF